ncbi:diablo, IAP-binding mitochondrial protein a [Sphaeramia orbicularis]|uniref:Direct IAP-binding protein with low pI n=1 Tax=Sphaeramia orbicularis TaxID=375764 RepID=A0A672YF61_9TELE|nr:diablo homolog, mitochondrial-like [Sphaeramia orbicularis]
MQAIRCSVCASRAVGGLQRPTNKSIIRKEAACIRFLSSSETSILSNAQPEVQKMVEWAEAMHMSNASPSADRGFYTVPFAQLGGNLSQDSIIKRAASMVTDSSSTFLSQATSALIDALTDYSKAVHRRITLQRRFLASLGKLTSAEEDFFCQLINGQRAEAADRLAECKSYESTWINAINLSKMAAETAYISGAEQASVTIRTNIQLAQSQVEEARKLSADADKKLAETKVEEIQRMAEYTAFLGDSEEHEVHEAYLRED